MDPDTLRARLREDLRRDFRGGILVDLPARRIYSSDASLFEIEPLAVALPRDEADLTVLVRYAYERNLPLVPRGGGTGLAGEALGHGIVVDLSAHFRSILEIGPDWVRVQPGVVLAHLNDALAGQGRRFAPDPASGLSCTIGGMIATNASGAKAAALGRTSEHVRALTVIWDDGTVDALGTAVPPQPRTAELQAAWSNLRQRFADLLTDYRQRTPFDRCGYRLDALDLLGLIPGSEGTLAIVTEATLRTIPVAAGRAVAAIALPSLDAALVAGLHSRQFAPTACELLDRRLVALCRSLPADTAIPSLPDADAILTLEFERPDADEARRSLQAFLATLPDRAAADVLLAGHTREDHDRLERLREAVRLALGAIPSGRRPLPFVEDIGIDPERLPAFLSEAITILKHYEVTSTIRVHVLTGQVHLRPLLDLSLEADAQKLWPLADRLHTLALDLGGTVSAQHGTGLARTPWVARQAGPLFPVFQELKRLFDPRNILNPGKIVGPDPSRPAWPLRSLPRPTRAPLLVWSAEEEARGVSSCNGCGACRADQPGIRMCPVFHALHTEAAAPRSKANLFRAFLDRSLTGASPDDLRQLADWCVNCRMCASECPSRVDVPKLMLETKAALHAAHGLKRSTWFLARLDGLASFASRFSLTTNFLLRRRSVRWLLEWLFGLSRRRTIPALAFRTFLGRARLRGWTRVGEDKTGVAYFVDTYANLFEPGLAEAAVAVLKHNGLRVHIPGRQTGSGAAALAQGDLDVARERLRANIRRLVPFAQAGATIVCSEPTAALFFRIDALHLADDPDVRTVAERTVELTAFLWELHQAGRLRTDFEPIEAVVAHHVPCHVKALGRGVHGSNLLGLIPGLHVDVLDVSCSGMAGAFGWNARNYPISLEAGKPMLQRFAQTQYQYGSSECSSCRIQMQQATGKRALHPVQYLALAYGLMPSIADRLKQPFTGLVSK